jgi:hypothetical protein
MSKSVKLHLILLPLIISSIYIGDTNAQNVLPGQWSLSIAAGYNIPVSFGMRGTRAQFITDAEHDYNTRRYPFGDDHAISGSIGGDLSYRFPNSALSAVASDRLISSYVDNGFPRNTTFYEGASMIVNTFGLGAEYSLGTPAEPLNTFGRGSLLISTILGSVEYYNSQTDLTPAVRFGTSVAIGERWNTSFAPLALEAAVDYTHANLIGKSYSAPSVSPPAYLKERALNDASNPSDPKDSPRAISYVGFELALRLWF